MNSAGRQVGGESSSNNDSILQTWSMGSSIDQFENWGPCLPDGCRQPVKQGRLYTYTFTWEARDCTPPPGPVVPAPGTPCPPFPPGTYTVIAEWTGRGAGPSARTTFQFTA
jgi:hypothetical protein